MAQYVPLITSFIAVLGALGGAWVANIFNEKRFQAQASLEKETQNKKLILGKAEDLYLLLTTWDKDVFNYQAYQLAVIKGELTKAQFHTFLSEFSARSTHDRLDTLLPLYFPELTPAMAELRRHLDSGNKAYHAHERNDLDTIEARRLLNASVKSTGQAFKELKKSLSAKVHGLIE
ncbi:TPA: hypothetical protein JG883_001840 [Enterobacter hormaechei subsp. xiangfangensis]|uniref:hypothetical protein n=1 Tax=Enterobacter hormaechei TaxID=158836 RepID=UPI000735B2E8|nr:hypothetical protein [Enterobacter hormaechei]KTJ91001.1 hypothetical protein ASU74_19735 [Enterobacter hormaechei subsp. xiangfangensis]HAS0862985.1 hypothetical protein [Enterobacter hormaechei subsp. xiangfangensis]HAV1664502.1 hypothetical protein [Enterobacter hormaechei subsp. xiangfangensis]